MPAARVGDRKRHGGLLCRSEELPTSFQVTFEAYAVIAIFGTWDQNTARSGGPCSIFRSVPA